MNIPRTAQVAWWGLGIRLRLPGSAHTQRRLASPSAKDLDEVGRIRESGASPGLRRRYAIEKRGLKHAHCEIDAGFDQHRPEGLTTRRQGSMQGTRGHVERARNVSGVERGIRAALSP